MHGRLFRRIAILCVMLALLISTVSSAQNAVANSLASDKEEQLLKEVLDQTHQLIDKENAKDFDAVERFVWNSPSALFVAKTATSAEGNWAGFWGHDVVVQHLHDVIFGGPFHIDPSDSIHQGRGRNICTRYGHRRICRPAASSEAFPAPDGLGKD
jgi:hypothetical protein